VAGHNSRSPSPCLSKKSTLTGPLGLHSEFKFLVTGIDLHPKVQRSGGVSYSPKPLAIHWVVEPARW
jgi:hypothetical protein